MQQKYLKTAEKLLLSIKPLFKDEKVAESENERTDLTFKKKLNFLHLYLALIVLSFDNDNSEEFLKDLEELDEVYANMLIYYKKPVEKRVKKRKLNNGESLPQE